MRKFGVDRLSLPVDTGSQAVYSVVDSNSHSDPRPQHELHKVDVGSSLIDMPYHFVNAPQWPNSLCGGLS